jgi:hypothetical protein
MGGKTAIFAEKRPYFGLKSGKNGGLPLPVNKLEKKLTD